MSAVRNLKPKQVGDEIDRLQLRVAEIEGRSIEAVVMRMCRLEERADNLGRLVHASLLKQEVCSEVSRAHADAWPLIVRALDMPADWWQRGSRLTCNEWYDRLVEMDKWSDTESYRLLWRSVYTDAMRESMSYDEAAVKWLTVPSDGVAFVGELSGLDVDYARERIKAMIVGMALTVARNRKPVYDRDLKQVVWKKPSKAERVRAKEFLQSATGLQLASEADIPGEQRARDEMLETAILLVAMAPDTHKNPSEVAEASLPTWLGGT